MSAPGWYNAQGDPPGTQRYWDGGQWVGDPVVAAVPAPPPMLPGQAPPAMDYVLRPDGASRAGRPADPGYRVLGRIIDVLILIPFSIVLIFLDIGGAANANLPNDSALQLRINSYALDTGIETFLVSFTAFVWATAWIHLKGGTPGKLLMGMRISDAQTGAMPVSLPQAALRSGNYLLSIVSLLAVGLAGVMSTVGALIGLVSLILLFSDNQHRTVMDRIAKTLVIQA